MPYIKPPVVHHELYGLRVLTYCMVSLACLVFMLVVIYGASVAISVQNQLSHAHIISTVTSHD